MDFFVGIVSGVAVWRYLKRYFDHLREDFLLSLLFYIAYLGVKFFWFFMKFCEILK